MAKNLYNCNFSHSNLTFAYFLLLSNIFSWRKIVKFICSSKGCRLTRVVELLEQIRIVPQSSKHRRRCIVPNIFRTFFSISSQLFSLQIGGWVYSFFQLFMSTPSNIQFLLIGFYFIPYFHHNSQMFPYLCNKI